MTTREAMAELYRIAAYNGAIHHSTR
jgi:hypothetical protein